MLISNKILCCMIAYVNRRLIWSKVWASVNCFAQTARYCDNGSTCLGNRVMRKLTGENLKVVLAEFSNLSLAVFVMSVITKYRWTRPHLKLKTQPRFCPVSLSSSMSQSFLYSQNECSHCGGFHSFPCGFAAHVAHVNTAYRWMTIAYATKATFTLCQKSR
jgi:hypothetical protein